MLGLDTLGVPLRDTLGRYVDSPTVAWDSMADAGIAAATRIPPWLWALIAALTVYAIGSAIISYIQDRRGGGRGRHES